MLGKYDETIRVHQSVTLLAFIIASAIASTDSCWCQSLLGVAVFVL